MPQGHHSPLPSPWSAGQASGCPSSPDARVTVSAVDGEALSPGLSPPAPWASPRGPWGAQVCAARLGDGPAYQGERPMCAPRCCPGGGSRSVLQAAASWAPSGLTCQAKPLRQRGVLGSQPPCVRDWDRSGFAAAWCELSPFPASNSESAPGALTGIKCLPGRPHTARTPYPTAPWAPSPASRGRHGASGRVHPAPLPGAAEAQPAWGAGVALDTRGHIQGGTCVILQGRGLDPFSS